jgi:hypothetical protein
MKTQSFEDPGSSSIIKNLHRSIFCLCLVACLACDNDSEQLGTILFSCDRECSFWLFDSAGRQVAKETIDSPTRKITVPMESSGVFVVQAKAGSDEIKKALTYVNGNIEYFIEFE